MSNEIDFQELQNDAEKGLFAKLADSRLYISLATEEPDVKFCLELGAMIMYGKPLLVVARPDQELPDKLVLVADAVVRVDVTSEGGLDELQEAITQFVADYPDDADATA